MSSRATHQQLWVLSRGKDSGLGKLRHIDTSFLYIQQINVDKVLRFDKTSGDSNPSDICTKGLAGPKIRKFIERMSMEFMTGVPVLRRILFDHILLPTTTSDQSCRREACMRLRCLRCRCGAAVSQSCLRELLGVPNANGGDRMQFSVFDGQLKEVTAPARP